MRISVEEIQEQNIQVAVHLGKLMVPFPEKNVLKNEGNKIKESDGQRLGFRWSMYRSVHVNRIETLSETDQLNGDKKRRKIEWRKEERIIESIENVNNFLLLLPKSSLSLVSPHITFIMQLSLSTFSNMHYYLSLLVQRVKMEKSY